MTDHPTEGAGMSETRLRNERKFHDQQAAERARVLQSDDYRFSDENYLMHESWIAPAVEALGNLAGQRVLDLGCGHGMASVLFARRGARVTGCDLSLGYLREARNRAVANDVATRLIVCDGERLPFADQSFDRIWGNAILHHLDLRRATRELYRVLAPGGTGVFCEPWGGNRWLNWARQRLYYPGKQRTADETPLRPCDLKLIRERFPAMQVQGFQLLAMLGRAVKHPRLMNSLGWCDRQILDTLPGWQQYCRYVVVTVRKEP
jgi:SAM-dependent methyltransferase